MSRPAAVLFALTAGVAASAAPVPKAAPEKPYFPTRVGTKLVYRWTEQAQGRPVESEVVVVVSAIEVRGDTTTATLDESMEGGCKSSDTHVMTPSGLFTTGSRVAEPFRKAWTFEPACLLKRPHRPGASWPYRIPAQPGGLVDVNGTNTAHGPEEVEVPAGKFRAVRVEFRDAAEPDTGSAAFWYAPGVGLVKMASRVVTQELVSVTPGPAK